MKFPFRILMVALLLPVEFTGSAMAGASRELRAGDNAPNVNLVLLGGTRVSILGLRSKIVLLAFFTTG